MTTTSDRLVQAAFATLARDRDLTDLDRQIMDAFQRLVLDQAELTDGTVNATNVIAESGVSRASYYRSPVAAVIKALLKSPDIERPETEILRAEIRALKKKHRENLSERAATIRELTDTKDTYANHIQVLTLRNAQLEEENHKLRQRHKRDSAVTSIHP